MSLTSNTTIARQPAFSLKTLAAALAITAAGAIGVVISQQADVASEPAATAVPAMDLSNFLAINTVETPVAATAAISAPMSDLSWFQQINTELPSMTAVAGSVGSLDLAWFRSINAAPYPVPQSNSQHVVSDHLLDINVASYEFVGSLGAGASEPAQQPSGPR